MQAYTITAKSTTDRVKLARWLRNIGPYQTVKDAVQAADDLLDGEDFEFYILGHQVIAAPEGVSLVPVVVEDPYTALYTAHFKQQEEYTALRDKGAAGDAEAAIAYCKLELEGKVSHGAFG